MKHKAIVFILDGLGDRPCAELEGQTPLQAAITPTLDALAANGQCGLVDPIAPGVRVETHTGVSALMGLAPNDALSIARGPVEGAGINLEMQPGDVVLRFNFATADQADEEGSFILRDRRAGRISADTGALCCALNTLSDPEDEPYIRAYPATHHRGVLVIRGKSVPDNISSNDLGAKGIDNIVPPVHTAVTQSDVSPLISGAINLYLQQAYDILDQHPVNQKRRQTGKPVANYLLLRGAGRYHRYDNLLNQIGLHTAVVAGERTVLGLGNLFGFTSILEKGFTASYDTDIPSKLRAAENALNEHDIVYVHLKASDIASHDHLPQAKADFISQFDKALSMIDLSNYVVAVCADHSTDCLRGEHNADPVPVILNFPNSRVDKVIDYSELSCAEGSIGRITAQHFIFSIIDAMDRIIGYQQGVLRR